METLVYIKYRADFEPARPSTHTDIYGKTDSITLIIQFTTGRKDIGSKKSEFVINILFL